MSHERLEDEDRGGEAGRVFRCDAAGCDEEFEETGTFTDVWEGAKGDGWRCRNVDGDWSHFCPDHARAR